MKPRTLTFAIPFALLAALILPSWLSAQIGGAGATNRIPIWTISNTLSNSKLFQTGAKVGVGTTNPAATLDVIGANGAHNTNGGNAPMTFQVIGGTGAHNLSGFGLQGAGASVKILSGIGASLPGLLAKGGTGATILLTGGTGATCIPASVRCSSRIGGDGGSVTLQPGTASPSALSHSYCTMNCFEATRPHWALPGLSRFTGRPESWWMPFTFPMQTGPREHRSLWGTFF